MAGANTYLDNDGRSVEVDLLYTVGANQVAYVDGWLGVTQRSGDSGDSVALAIDRRAYQFTVPSGLSVSKGDVVYVDPAQLTSHVPDEAGYTTTAADGLVALFKAVEDKDDNDVVVGVLMGVDVV